MTVRQPMSENSPTSQRANVALTLAASDYDHVRDLVTGVVPVEGVDLTCLTLSVEEIFFRFAHFQEWDVSEFSLGKYVAMRSQGDDSLVAIPVFPSRVFRHSAIFVRADRPVREPTELRGRRVGIPEWTATATVYSRGVLQHEYGVDLTSIEWIQAGMNEAGRVEGVAFSPPPGITIRALPDRTLNDLLLAGEIDCIIGPNAPAGAYGDPPKIVRLIEDHRRVEQEYFDRTGVFPIMHLIAIRREAYEAHRWIAMNLLTAFEAAKERSLARAVESTASRFPVPWLEHYVRSLGEHHGIDRWAYGVDANRVTLDAFLQMAHEQGVMSSKLTADELFVPEVQAAFRV
jgi:4,5-dihydroxyphthalate decarboxylase